MSAVDARAIGQLADHGALAPWTVRMAVELQAVSEPAISPDGALVAFVVSDAFKPSATAEPPSRIWAVRTSGGAPYPLTSGYGRERSPRWSPRGDSVAFLSDRADPAGTQLQLYVLPLDGGEARQLTSVMGQIDTFAWAPDSARIFFLGATPAEQDEAGIVRYEARPSFQRLWSVDIQNGAILPLSPPNIQIWEFAIAADGQTIALVESDEPWAWSWYRSRLSLLRRGTISTLFDPGARQVARPVFSPDGTRVAFISSSWSDRGCVLGGDVYAISTASTDGRAENLTHAYGKSAAACDWVTDSEIIFCGYDGSEAIIGTLLVGEQSTRPRTLWVGQVAFQPRLRPLFHRRGRRLAFVREDFTHVADLWVAQLNDAGITWAQLTDLNPWVAERAFGEASILRWTSFDGLEIEGILIKPLNYRPGQHYPLVLGVHGGPTNMAACRMQVVWEQVLAARGCAVLWPNFRGSSGRGVAFSEANLGDMGGGDFKDLMAGVDFCIDSGLADPARLGITGQSYGGFMTAWAITQTERFAAAVAGASITNWRSFHGTSRVHMWDTLFLKATPYEGDVYARWSPVMYARRVRTPTLFLHGACDEDVPAGQSYEMFRALKDHGVSTELRIYPREQHGFREQAHVVDRDEHTVAWLARHLGLPAA